MGPQETPIDTLCRLFGSQRILATALDVSPSKITYWRKPAGKVKGHAASNRHHGNGGRVPPEYNMRILGAAIACGVDFEAVNECLDKVCPACKQPLPMEG